MQTDQCEKRLARRTWCEVVVARSRSMRMIVGEDAVCRHSRVRLKKNRNAERRRRENRGAEHRGAEAAEDRGAVGAENQGAEGVGYFFDFRPRNSVFGAFWALYFTIQVPALRTESGYIHVGDRYI